MVSAAGVGDDAGFLAAASLLARVAAGFAARGFVVLAAFARVVLRELLPPVRFLPFVIVCLRQPWSSSGQNVGWGKITALSRTTDFGEVPTARMQLVVWLPMQWLNIPKDRIE